MTTDNKFKIIKAIANVASAVSMVTLITLGIAYMSFDNDFVFKDVKIEVVNKPVNSYRDIEFIMIGYKKFESSKFATL